MLNFRCSIEHSTLNIEHYDCSRFTRKSSGLVIYLTFLLFVLTISH